MNTITSWIKWNKNLHLGLNDIDLLHAQLFKTVDELKKTNPQKRKQAFDKLRRDALLHYQHEKNMMHLHHIDFEYQQMHLIFHEHYISYIDQIRNRIDDCLMADWEPFLLFLLKWLQWHIITMDSFLAKQILNSDLKLSEQERNHIKAIVSDSVYFELGKKTWKIVELEQQIDNETARRKSVELSFSLSDTRLQALIDFSNSWEYWEEPDGKISYTSPSCEHITGYSAAEFLENPGLIYDIIHPDDRHIMELHQKDKKTHEDFGQELLYRIIQRDGTVRHIAHHCHVVYSRENRFLGRRGSVRDRTDLHEQAEQQRLAETVFTSVNEAVLVTDQAWKILRVNPSFTEITGETFDAVQGKSAFLLFDEVHQQEWMQQVTDSVEKTGLWQGEFLGLRKNRHSYDGWISIYSVKNKDKQLINYVLVFSDISERKKNEDKIYKLAHFDLLTGLPNRALLLDRLQQSMLKAKRESHFLALMFVDLDKFKSVNDTLGHYIGDLLLKAVADRLLECVRESDTVARIGGDEFIVLLPIIQLEDDAKKVGRKILECITEDYLLEGNLVQIGVSVGIAIFPIHGNTHEELMTNADAAMYEAKHGSGPSVISFSELAKQR